MSDVFKCFVFYVAFTLFKVTGIDFTISRENVLLGSTGTLTLRCNITETDVETLYNIQIKQLRSPTLSGNNDDEWQRLAFMRISIYENPTLDSAIIPSDKHFVAGGSWDSDTPANTYLTLSMNIEKFVCADARTFKCELSYFSNSQSTKQTLSKNTTFTAYVKPQVTSLVARKNGCIVQGMSPSDMATAYVGDELEFTCTANIGSSSQTMIRWHRTPETFQNDEFIGYQPSQGTFDEGSAISDNKCGYIRVASIRYNTTSADANRDNNLAFECYVTVSGDPYGNSYISENNPRFYTEVYNPCSEDSGNTMITTDGNEISISAAVIAAIVITSLIVGVLIGVVFTLVILNRKRTVTGPKSQNQHQPTRETELNVPSLSPNTYEQLQNRIDTESRITYDSLDASANSSAVQDSQSQYESLTRGGGGTSHTNAGLNNNQ